MTAVKDQGRCGACWAFSTTAAFESFLMQTDNKEYDLSEEYLVECTTDSDCSGGYISSALGMITWHGLPEESTYPYVATNTGSGRPVTSGICNTNRLVQHSNKYNTYKYSYATDDELKSYLQIGPLAVGIWADSGFMSYSGGNYRCARSASSSNINHAVQLIGYDTSGNWIIKNSWGTNWGINGYGYITSNSSGNCGINIQAYRLFSGRLVFLIGFVTAIVALL